MIERPLLTLLDLPVYQNKMFPTPELARQCPRGNICLAQDTLAGHVRNSRFDPSLLAYDESYQNEQSHSQAFSAHLQDVLALIQRHFSRRSILEVGCGKGAFVDLLRERGHDATGVDPAYEGVSEFVTKSHFTADLGLRADAIVMRHTLEHIQDPWSFLARIREANSGSGLIYIEVPCFDWILQRRAWFDVFYEHVNYFRISDFHRAFGQVIESGRLFGGQYLYAIADLASLKGPDDFDATTPVKLPPDFFDGLDATIAELGGRGRNIIWGGAAKGVMFANYLLQRGVQIDFVIDINPAKQGYFLAGSGLPVVHPADGLARLDAGDKIIVMNSNYFTEIYDYAGAAYDYLTVDHS